MDGSGDSAPRFGAGDRVWCRGDAMTFEGVVLYVSACRCPMDGFPVYRVLRDGEAEGPPGFELCESVLEPVVGDRSGVDP